MNQAVERVDPVLAEDGRTVALYLWGAGDELIGITQIELPMPIDEESFLLDEWRAAAVARRRSEEAKP